MKKWKQIVEKTMEEVKENYPQVNGIEFGTYYEANHHFVAYIFNTNMELLEAKENKILDKIQNCHREKMISNGYPLDSVNICLFATQEDCVNECGGNWYYYFK